MDAAAAAARTPRPSSNSNGPPLQARLARFRRHDTLAAALVTEEYLARHARPWAAAQDYHAASTACEAQASSSSTELPYDENVHNRFHRQRPPMKAAAAAAAAPPPAAPALPTAAGATGPPLTARQQRPCCRARPATTRPPGPTAADRHGSARQDPLPEDDVGVLTARLLQERRKQRRQQPHQKQQQQQQQLPQHSPGGWREELKRERGRRKRGQPSPHAAKPRQPTSSGGPTAFRQAYDRGSLPCSVLHHPGPGGNRVKWHLSPQTLDYRALLPLFIEGLREAQDPYRFLAIQGAMELMEACPTKLPACLPHILPPLKAALGSSDPVVVATALKVLQDMVLVDPLRVGPALLPHYHSLLGAAAVFQRFKDEDAAAGGDYAQQRRRCLRRLVNETLELLELTGGPQAFVHIKYMVPSYERKVPLAPMATAAA